MESCENHFNLPQFQEMWSTDNYRKEPTAAVVDLNQQIDKVNAKNNFYALVTSIALAAIVIPLIVYRESSRIPSAVVADKAAVSQLIVKSLIFFVGLQIYNYITYRNCRSDLTQKLDNFYKTYADEFIFSNDKMKKSIFREPAKEAIVKKYCNSPESLYHKVIYLYHKVIYKTHFQLCKSSVGFGSITQLKLEKRCETNNSQEVQAKYQPWLELLIKLDRKIPLEFGKLIIKMAGFECRLTDTPFFYEFSHFVCGWHPRDKYIWYVKKKTEQEGATSQLDLSSLPHSSMLDLVPQEVVNSTTGDVKIISTPEECLAFIEGEFYDK